MTIDRRLMLVSAIRPVAGMPAVAGLQPGLPPRLRNGVRGSASDHARGAQGADRLGGGRGVRARDSGRGQQARVRAAGRGRAPGAARWPRRHHALRARRAGDGGARRHAARADRGAPGGQSAAARLRAARLRRPARRRPAPGHDRRRVRRQPRGPAADQGGRGARPSAWGAGGHRPGRADQVRRAGGQERHRLRPLQAPDRQLRHACGAERGDLQGAAGAARDRDPAARRARARRRIRGAPPGARQRL